MKYMIEYKVRHGHETEKNFASGEALLTAFSKWKPDDGLKVHTFLSSLMGDSGYVLVETDDPKLSWLSVRDLHIGTTLESYRYWT